MLAPDVVRFAEFLANYAAAYDNHLKWNEEARFKADLMNSRQRWQAVDANAFFALLNELGMRLEDATMLTDYLRRTQAGRRVIANKAYRDFVWPEHPREPGRQS